MLYRPYGRDKIELSVIGFGGIVVMNAEQSVANQEVAAAVERGINYFDVAPQYGDAEMKLGPALEPFRKDCFLACKTLARDAESGEEELTRSLERLRTDRIDLYQMHALSSVEKDVDTAFSRGGVIELFDKAKRDGRVRYLGFSAHSVDAAMAAMERYDFDSILFPVNYACWEKGGFGPQVLKKAEEKGMSVLALKAMARQPWLQKGDPRKKEYPKCWYEPVMDADEALISMRYVLQKGVTALLPPGQPELFHMAMDLADRLALPCDVSSTNIDQYAAEYTPLFRA